MKCFDLAHVLWQAYDISLSFLNETFTFSLGLSVLLFTVMTDFAQPKLTIKLADNNKIELSWSESGNSYNLEKASLLSMPSV